MWWTGLRGWKQMHKASFLFSDVSLCLAPRKLGKDFRPRKDTPSTPLGVWTESISLGKQERAFIEPRSFFISQSGFQPRRRSAGRLPFHLSSCMFNPLLSSLPAHLRLCPARIVHIPPHVFPNLIHPASHWSLPLNPALSPTLPASIQLPLTLLLLLSPKDKHSTGWTLSLLHQPPCSPGRQRVCSRIRSGFVPLRKEGTNQTLICRCILCLMERSWPTGGWRTRARMHAWWAEWKPRVGQRKKHTHTHTPARRNPTPRQTRAWVCVRSSTALLLAVCVRTRVFPHRPAAAFVPRAGLFSDWLANVWDTDLCYSSSAAALIWQILFSLLSSGARGHGGDVRQLRRRAARIAPPVWPCVCLPSSHGVSCKVCLHTISYCSTHLQPLYQQVGWLASTHTRPLHISWIYQMGLARVKFSPALRFR